MGKNPRICFCFCRCLFFSCHPSPKAEDLLSSLPLPLPLLVLLFVIPQRSGGICCCLRLCCCRVPLRASAKGGKANASHTQDASISTVQWPKWTHNEKVVIFDRSAAKWRNPKPSKPSPRA